MSAISEHVIRTSVLETCSKFGVSHDSPLAQQLMNEAEIQGDRNAIVRTTSGASLDERLQELAKVPKFAGSMPTAKPVVASTDMASMSAHIEDIAAGRMTVK